MTIFKTTGWIIVGLLLSLVAVFILALMVLRPTPVAAAPTMKLPSNVKVYDFNTPLSTARANLINTTGDAGTVDGNGFYTEDSDWGSPSVDLFTAHGDGTRITIVYADGDDLQTQLATAENYSTK